MTIPRNVDALQDIDQTRLLHLAIALATSLADRELIEARIGKRRSRLCRRLARAIGMAAAQRRRKP